MKMEYLGIGVSDFRLVTSMSQTESDICERK